MVKVIKDEKEYEAALAQVNTLIDLDPNVGTAEAEQLELLSVLIEDYESRVFPKSIPNPIEAIRFRMEQQNLKQRDLVPYIGSPSKVSEVLAGKRPLTLSMIRALHSGLRIPALVLLQEKSQSMEADTSIEWERFPLKEMFARGWIKEGNSILLEKAEDTLRRFFAPIRSPLEVAALYKKTNKKTANAPERESLLMPEKESVRASRSMDKYALAAWTARIMILAVEDPPPVKYEHGCVTLEFMREVIKLSWYESGPLLAQEYLRKRGIPLIIEPHLPQTHLDGAAIMIWKDRPVIGLTIRHDRIDNFWFCLMHELAHVSLHYGQGFTHFYDDLDVKQSDDPREREADELAGEALIPQEEWQNSPARVLKSPQAAQDLADKLRIHPAIVAGRMRHATKSYQTLNPLVGHGQVRRLFKETTWPK